MPGNSFPSTDTLPDDVAVLRGMVVEFSGKLAERDSVNGGRTAAVMYSVISSAKRHGLDPWKYLRDVFSRLPDMTVSQLPELGAAKQADKRGGQRD
jgi:hypothetical protein